MPRKDSSNKSHKIGYTEAEILAQALDYVLPPLGGVVDMIGQLKTKKPRVARLLNCWFAR